MYFLYALCLNCVVKVISRSLKYFQVKRGKKKSGSAATSPSSDSISPSKQSTMHETYAGTNYIINKENKIHSGLDLFPQNASIEINDFHYSEPDYKNHNPPISPMTSPDIGNSRLFEDLDGIAGSYNDEPTIPSIQSSKTEDVANCFERTKVRTKKADEVRETCLDDSINDTNSNNLLKIKPRKAVYQKDTPDCNSSKTNIKLSKSNETKHISKSKSTRMEGVAASVPTKGALKKFFNDSEREKEGRKKSMSDLSDKEDSKTHSGTKERSAKKNSVEQSPNTTSNNNNSKKEKNPKRDRLKPKLAAVKNTITIDESMEQDEKPDLNDIPDISSPPTQPPSGTTTSVCTATTTTTASESMPPTLLKTTTCDILHDPIPNLTTNSGFGFLDKLDLVTTTLSPMTSPESLVPKCTEPPRLVKEIKDEEMVPPYISASPLGDFDLGANRGDLNVSINSQAGNTLVNGMFTTSQRVMDDHINNYEDMFNPTSISLDQLHTKPQPLLISEMGGAESILIDPMKPDVSDVRSSDLWINDDLDSVDDIENIVPKTHTPPTLPPIELPSTPILEDVVSDESTSCGRVLTGKCVNTTEPMSKNDVPTKLTIRIPLAGIKLKNNQRRCRNRTNSTSYTNINNNNNIKSKSNNNNDNNNNDNTNDSLNDCSLSPNSESFEIDVVNDRSPLKRKRRKLSDGNCDDSTGIKAHPLDYQDLEKLVIRISLAKLRRAPLKEPLITDTKVGVLVESCIVCVPYIILIILANFFRGSTAIYICSHRKKKNHQKSEEKTKKRYSF